MVLVFAEVDTESAAAPVVLAAVLVSADGLDKSLGNLVVLRLLVAAAALLLAVALAAELGLPSLHSNNRHY